MCSGSSRVLAIICMVSGVNSAIDYRFCRVYRQEGLGFGYGMVSRVSSEGQLARQGWILGIVWLAGQLSRVGFWVSYMVRRVSSAGQLGYRVGFRLSYGQQGQFGRVARQGWVSAIVWLAGLVRQSGQVGLGFGYRMISRVSIIAVWCTCIL